MAHIQTKLSERFKMNSDTVIGKLDGNIHAINSDFAVIGKLFSESVEEIEDIREFHEEFSKVNKFGFEVESEKIYEIINNLIEKSIGNYIVNTSWKKAKHHVSK